MRVLITLILIYLFAFGCANIQSPPGGAGDTTAPSVEYTYPVDRTINFQDDEMTIGFNEYMNRSKVIENLHISPDVKMSFDWSSTDLHISFLEPLRPNTTYAVNLGTEFTDYHNNQPKQGYSIIFSTGNKLDSGSIIGYLSAPDTKGKYMYLYKKKDGEYPNMATTKPDYYVNTGSSGIFQFVALTPGEYRVIAVDDRFQNGIYDDQVDSYGTALNDVILTEDKLLVGGVNIFLGGKTDEVGPKLLNASSQYAGIANVLFDENLDYNTLVAENFSLTSNGENVPVMAMGINRLTTSEVILIFDKNTAGKDLKLTVKSIADSTGNSIQEASNYTNFTVDSTYNMDEFTISTTNLNDSTQKNISPKFNILSQSSVFKLKFNKIPDVSTLENAAYLESNGNKTNVKLLSNNLLDYFFVSDSILTENAEYTLVFNTSDITDLWGNRLTKDTIYRTKFKTSFEPKSSLIGGTVELVSDCGGDIIVTAKNISDKSEYTTALTDGKWKFDKVTPGSYIFEIYCDANKNGKFDFGSINPFEYREKYSKSTEHKIAENWEYNDIKLILNE